MNRKVAITFGDAARLSPYESAMRSVGLEPVRNPESLDGLAGLLLAGGTDVNPALYGQEPDPRTDRPDDGRDKLELRLLEEAFNSDRPVLGICRGLQMMNVARGGTLLQHIDGHQVRTPDPSVDIHLVHVEAKSRLGSVLGFDPKPVNSRHHQAVGRIGDGIVVSATAEDGIIEGLERQDRTFALAVQWHTEDRCFTDPRDRRLFEAFAAAVARISSE